MSRSIAVVLNTLTRNDIRMPLMRMISPSEGGAPAASSLVRPGGAGMKNRSTCSATVHTKQVRNSRSVDGMAPLPENIVMTAGPSAWPSEAVNT